MGITSFAGQRIISRSIVLSPSSKARSDSPQARAATLYRAAAEQGDSWACYLLGLCYRDGEGVRRNRRSARKWFRCAADSGEKEAMKALSELDAP